MHNDDIDPRYWIRPDESVVNEHRAAKGDLNVRRNERGRIDAAEVRDDTLLAFLVSRGVLDELHAHYALILTDLQRAFRRPVDYKGNSIYALEFFSTESLPILDTLYLRVMRLLVQASRRYEPTLVFVCNTLATRRNIRIAYSGKYPCRDAFDALVEVIDKVRNEENPCAKS